MDMVEKVREAISPILLRRETADQDSFDWATEVARAAIEAMREPTDAMLAAFWEAGEDCWGGTHGVVRKAVGAMMSQALSNQPRPTEEKA